MKEKREEKEKRKKRKRKKQITQTGRTDRVLLCPAPAESQLPQLEMRDYLPSSTAAVD